MKMKLKQAQAMVQNIRSFIFRSYRTSPFSGSPWSILNLLSHHRVWTTGSPTNQPVCQREIRIDGSLFLEIESAHLACGLGRVVLRGAMESCMYAHHDSGAALRGCQHPVSTSPLSHTGNSWLKK